MADLRLYDGIDDKIQIVDPTGMDPSGALTLGFWIRADAHFVNGNVICVIGNDSETVALTRGFVFCIDGFDKLRIGSANGPQNARGTTSLTTDGSVWYRAGFKKTATSTYSPKVYLNGVDDTATAGWDNNALNITTGDVFATGRRTNDATIDTSWWDGALGIGLWFQGVALTAAQLDGYLLDPQSAIDDYGPTGTITANVLKIFWPQACDNATEEDLSGVGNDGTYSGTSTITATPPSYPTDDFCASAGDINLNPTGSSLASADFTDPTISISGDISVSPIGSSLQPIQSNDIAALEADVGLDVTGTGLSGVDSGIHTLQIDNSPNPVGSELGIIDSGNPIIQNEPGGFLLNPEGSPLALVESGITLIQIFNDPVAVEVNPVGSALSILASGVPTLNFDTDIAVNPVGSELDKIRSHQPSITGQEPHVGGNITLNVLARIIIEKHG